jgi:hypothetical protein
LATRLSFFIWNTNPDDELLKLATSKELSKTAGTRCAVKRMIADPRASSLVSNFVMKWLGLSDLDTMKPDQQIYTSFNDQLKNDLVTEAERFINSVLLENRPLVDLLNVRRDLSQQRVARHYGLTAFTKPVPVGEVDRQESPGPARQGRGADSDILPGSDVACPSWRMGSRQDHRHAADTAASWRGDGSESKARETPKTVRARLEQHRDNATSVSVTG